MIYMNLKDSKIQDMIEENIALLIDGDNFSANRFNELMLKLSAQGRVRIKRIYGDFSSPTMNSWKDRSIRCRLNAVQQFSKKSGNSTDMKLIIDAMDILYKYQDITTFCIASSDADYLSLVARLQEEGKYVIVAGGEFISVEMRNSADSVIIMESQKSEKEAEKQNEITNLENKMQENTNHEIKKPVKDSNIFIPVSEISGKQKIKRAFKQKSLKNIKDILVTAFSNLKDTDGWCKRIALGLEISRLRKLEKKISYPGNLNENSRLKDILNEFPEMFEKRGKGYNSELKIK